MFFNAAIEIMDNEKYICFTTDSGEGKIKLSDSELLIDKIKNQNNLNLSALQNSFSVNEGFITFKFSEESHSRKIKLTREEFSDMLVCLKQMRDSLPDLKKRCELINELRSN